MNVNIENLVRSGVVLVVGLPLALSLGSLVNTTADLARSGKPTNGELSQRTIKDKLAVPCVKFLLSKNDSKMERAAKNQIDEILGGEVNYGAVCKWAL